MSYPWWFFIMIAEWAKTYKH